MKIWTAIFFVMYLVSFPSLRDYWNETETNHGVFGNTFIRTRMGRMRWTDIKNNLHPDINSLMADLRRRNKQYYYPTCQMSINETLFLYKGKVRFRQRM